MKLTQLPALGQTISPKILKEMYVYLSQTRNICNVWCIKFHSKHSLYCIWIAFTTKINDQTLPSHLTVNFFSTVFKIWIKRRGNAPKKMYCAPETKACHIHDTCNHFNWPINISGYKGAWTTDAWWLNPNSYPNSFKMSQKIAESSTRNSQNTPQLIWSIGQNQPITYSRLRNKHRGTLINFWKFLKTKKV